MNICGFLMHFCFLLARCSNFYPIQMHPHFPHFWPQRKASALHELKAKSPEKASRTQIEFYFSKFKRTLSLPVTLHFSAHPTYLTLFLPSAWAWGLSRKLNICGMICPYNWLFISLIWILNAMTCSALHARANFSVELAFRRPQNVPQNALTIHHRDSFINAQKSNIKQWDMMQQPANI